MKKQKFNCPAEMCLSLIGGKWKAILLYNLRSSPQRFGELKRLSPGITQTMLSKELKALEEAGLVHRHILGRDRLSGVEYELSPRGQTLKPLLAAMIRWGLTHQSDYVLGDYGMASFTHR